MYRDDRALKSPSQAGAARTVFELAEALELDRSDVEPYGWHVGKLSLGLHERLADRPLGRYVGVTAINPTPLGEGKTVVAIGLAMALSRRGHRSIVTLREPSQAPVFGIKGGGAGGGRAGLIPSDAINLHFTGDLHAVAAANNLLAAMVDNHSQRGLAPAIQPDAISWRRVIDVNDASLASIETGLDANSRAPRRRTGFDLAAASEVMSILALATNLRDLRDRLGRIVVARGSDGDFITANRIGAAGAMAALLCNALRPNLVQTTEHTPAIVHAGPFANISHGNSSVIGDLTALRLADYVVTESGFGADLGAEKFFNIKCRAPGLRPRAEVLVCSLRAVKFHSGGFDVRPGRSLPEDILRENGAALQAGMANVESHLDILRRHGVAVVVAINRFPTDSEVELRMLRRMATESGADRVVIVDAFGRGGEGALELADAVIDACSVASDFSHLYPLEASYEEKIETIAQRVYGAEKVDFGEGLREQLGDFGRRGFDQLPVCIAKTQYSLSHDAKLLGRPRGFRLPIREVRLAAGAGFVLALTDGISLMPRLPRQPNACKIDVDFDGGILGLNG